MLAGESAEDFLYDLSDSNAKPCRDRLAPKTQCRNHRLDRCELWEETETVSKLQEK